MDGKSMSPAGALAALGLTLSASEEEIKSTYHKLMSLYHPDANGGEMSEKFLVIRDAYEYLMTAIADGSLQAERDRIAYEEAVRRAREEAAARQAMQTMSMPRRPAKILGNKTAMKESKLKRRFAVQHAKQEERSRRRHIEEKQKMLEDDTAYQEKKKYDEAMMKIHAVLAAEVAAKLYRELRKST